MVSPGVHAGHKSVHPARIEWVRLKIITGAVQTSSPTPKWYISSPKATASLLVGCFTASLSLSYLPSCPWYATDCLEAKKASLLPHTWSSLITFPNPLNKTLSPETWVSKLLLYFCHAHTDTQNLLTSLRCKTHCSGARVFKTSISKASISCGLPRKKKGLWSRFLQSLMFRSVNCVQLLLHIPGLEAFILRHVLTGILCTTSCLSQSRARLPPPLPAKQHSCNCNPKSFRTAASLKC